MKYLLIIICSAFTIFLNAQQPVNGPSNQSFNYNSLVNSSYNPGNGTANVTIPIGSINEGSINHTIALLSNTDAPKVSEMASTVGLGWSLNAGGMISRSIRGLPDDDEGGYYTLGGDGIIDEDVKNGDRDSEPDMYFFNAGSFSGFFTIDEDGDFHTIPKSRIKIEEFLNASDEFINFVITDDLGTKYHFGLSDPSLSYHGLEREIGNLNYTTTGWMLNKIESLDGELLFEYQEALSSTLYMSEQLIHTYVDVGNNNDIINSDIINTGNLTDTDNLFRSSHILTYVPHRIISKTKTIEFGYTDERDDIGTSIFATTDNGNTEIFGKRLTEIKILEGDLADCKTFVLNQTYFIDNSTPIPEWNYLPRVSKRLKFDNVIQKSCDGSELLPTVIEYYGQNGGTFFPNQFHTDIDDWGYYNNGGNGSNLIKSGFGVTVNNWVANPPTLILPSPGEADRLPRIDATKNGAIKKITYPTGGSVTYEYELNSKNEVMTTSELFNLRSDTDCDEEPADCCNWFYSQHTQPIFISSDVKQNGKITLNLIPFGTSSCVPDDSELILKIFNTNLTIEYGSISINYSSSNDDTFLSVDVSDIDELENQSFYRFRLQSKLTLDGTYAKLKVPASESSQAVGGLRLKKSITHDGLDLGNDIIVEYDYSKSEESEVSSGVSFLPHDLYYNIPFDITPQAIFHYSPQHSFHNFYGSHITYERVKTINNQHGYTINNLTNIIDSYETQYPLVPQPYNNQLGFMASNEVYNSNDELVSKVTNVQNEDDLYDIHSTPIFSLRVAPFYDYFNDNLENDHIYKSNYSIKNGISRIQSSTSFMDGQEYSTEYEYFTGTDAEKCFAPQYTKITDDLGLKYVSRHKYTFDYDIDEASPQNNDGDDSYCIKNELNTLNIVGLLWQTETRYEGVLISGTRKKYKRYDTNTGERILCSGLPTSNTTLKLWKDYRIENTWIDGSFVNTGWQPLSQIERYDRIDGGEKLRGPEKITMDQWQNYTENVYDNLNRLTETKKVTNVVDAQPTILTSYSYHGTSGLIFTVTAPDTTYTTYEYDEFLRKYQETDCHGVETTIDYAINGISENTPDNFITTTTDYSLNYLNTDDDGLSQVSTLVSKGYLDGLGRNVQNVDVNQAQDVMKDLVSINQFDSYGNSTKSYYQYESDPNNNGGYTSPPAGLKHSTQVFEAAPSNRVKSIEPPGGLDEIITDYSTNNSIDAVLFYDNPSQAHYDPGTLKKTINTDQNGHKSIAFTNRFGKLVLSRRENDTASKRSDTYYLYDPKHRLIKVIPPGADAETTPDMVYEYSYFGNNKLRSKKLPGADKILFLYNKRELLAATQDGNMRTEAPDKWMAYEYDEHGRMVKTGFITETFENESIINPTITEVLSTHTFDIKHRPEMDEHKILGTSDFLYTKYNYNFCGDLTGIRSNHHLYLNPLYNSYIEDFFYDGMGNLVEQNTIVYLQGSILRYDERHHYDHTGRNTYNEIRYGGSSNPWKTICRSEYDDQERLITKYLGQAGATWLQKVDYEYYDWGALKTINGDELTGTEPLVAYHNNNESFTGGATLDENDVFQMKFTYNSGFVNGIQGSNTDNGNITAIEWQTRGKRPVANFFDYDYKNQLEAAQFWEEKYVPMTSSWNYVRTQDHEASFDYDNRGNIELITRKNRGATTTIDHNYITGSNQLLNSQITDNWNSLSTYTHEYNDNGSNILYQDNPVEYNYMDLPTSVHGELSHVGITPIAEFVYSSSGSKLTSKFLEYNMGNITKFEFIGPFELTYESGTLSNTKVHYENGFLNVQNNSSPTYNYVLTDHLGSNRITFSDKDGSEAIDNPSEITSRNDYYPFGKGFKENNSAGHRQKYNYIENGFHDNQIDLNFATFRTLDANLGLWLQVDPKAESAYGHSPYNSMFNNPISMSDPDGDLPFLAIVGIGAATGIFSNGLSNVSQGQGFFNGAGKAALWGGIGAAASLGVGSIFGGTGSALNELGRAGAHALSGGLQSHLQGGSFGQGLLSGGVSSVIGSTLSGSGAGAQIFGSGLGGGAGSVIGGGNFFHGFGQGVAVGAFNHTLHSGAEAIESSLNNGDPPWIKRLLRQRDAEALAVNGGGTASEYYERLRVIEGDAAVDAAILGFSFIPVGAAYNGLKSLQFAKWAFNSRLIGGKSFLFGRGSLGAFGGKANGILNRTKFRIGWSWNNATKTHLFQPRYGSMYNATHFRSWIKYKP